MKSLLGPSSLTLSFPFSSLPRNLSHHLLQYKHYKMNKQSNMHNRTDSLPQCPTHECMEQTVNDHNVQHTSVWNRQSMTTMPNTRVYGTDSQWPQCPTHERIEQTVNDDNAQHTSVWNRQSMTTMSNTRVYQTDSQWPQCPTHECIKQTVNDHNAQHTSVSNRQSMTTMPLVWRRFSSIHGTNIQLCRWHDEPYGRKRGPWRGCKQSLISRNSHWVETHWC